MTDQNETTATTYLAVSQRLSASSEFTALKRASRVQLHEAMHTSWQDLSVNMNVLEVPPCWAPGDPQPDMHSAALNAGWTLLIRGFYPGEFDIYAREEHTKL